MKKLLLMLPLLLSGCMFGKPDIQCWYAQSLTSPQTIQLRGLTDNFHTDNYGPIFTNIEALNKYVVDQHLKMCGVKE